MLYRDHTSSCSGQCSVFSGKHLLSSGHVSLKNARSCLICLTIRLTSRHQRHCAFITPLLCLPSPLSHRTPLGRSRILMEIPRWHSCVQLYLTNGIDSIIFLLYPLSTQAFLLPVMLSPSTHPPLRPLPWLLALTWDLHSRDFHPIIRRHR